MLQRISELNWLRILFTRSAAILLGIAAILTGCAVLIMHSDIKPESLNPAEETAIGILGAAGAFGFFALLVCMWFFWLRCDSSPKIWRTIWFIILLLGFFYGSAVLYYVIVYLPAVLGRIRNRENTEPDIRPMRSEESPRRIGPFNRLLLVGWGLMVLSIAVVLVLPKPPEAVLASIAALFFVCSAVVVLEAMFHAILSLYRSGMSRPTDSDRAKSSRRRNRD
jgi:small-conductance mechanosensitive channel